MLAKLNKITSWQASTVIAVVGFAVYFTGLTNPFWGDDGGQIVDNVPVHSITHIKLFFEGGTFYVGKGLAPLSGTYFRPLMTTVFSLIYTLFGAHPFYYHMFQLFLCIGSSIVLYLLFRYSFKPVIALFLSLIFLVHPINSQVAFAIASMQDALFFFFGILAIWLLIRFRSTRSLLAVTACLILSLLSKESGVLFIAMALLYLFWFDRKKRLFSFVGIMALPIVLYVVLRIHAIGILGHSNIAPIDNLSLSGRLMTAPSIVSFFISKLIFPWRLATGYYWVYPTFSFRHVLLPLMVILLAVALMCYLALAIRRKAAKAMFYTFLFFAIWAAIGLGLLLQIIPLDMTACETWFYFPMAGVLGMAGVALTVFPPRIKANWVLFLAVLLISVLGFRTALRGFDWRNQYSLAYKDIAASKEDFNAYNAVAEELIKQGKYAQAKTYVQRSINIYPTYSNYNNLGLDLGSMGDYSGAMKVYEQGLRYGNNTSLIYDNLAELTLVTGNPNSNKQFLESAVEKFPGDPTLWMYVAIFAQMYNDNAFAKAAISRAANYGSVPQIIYYAIINDQQVRLNLNNLDISIVI